jgi:hypothetical protein
LLVRSLRVKIVDAPAGGVAGKFQGS